MLQCPRVAGVTVVSVVLDTDMLAHVSIFVGIEKSKICVFPRLIIELCI